MSANERTSLIVVCCNQVAYTRRCLESVLRHTDTPYELLLIDNGSTDDTPAYLEAMKSRPGPERVEVIRNATNLGFAVACNQGLSQSRGRYLVLLNNDTVVTSHWLDGLLAWARRGGTEIGMVGPVTGAAAPPQEIAVDYRTDEELEAFAASRRDSFRGKALEVQRLLGFCLLLRREVLEAVGGLDERFGLGFFEDDDLCVRARRAGFRLVVAEDVFVHHFGGRTFAGLGLDAHQQLHDNFAKFKEKWGEEAACYRLPKRTLPPTPSPKQGGGEKQVSPSPLRGGGRGERLRSSRPKVSLCMIVKNEECRLAACLRSVADLVDEMVVVDTGSTDHTRGVAAAAGARVFDFAGVNSFAAARNESLRHARGDWILWLDADERLDEDNRRRLRALLGQLGEENVCYLMRQRSPLEESAHAATAVDQVRLFRNQPDVRWIYRVHEQILPAVRRAGGTVVPTAIVIEHAGYAETAAQGAKVERNRRLLELELAENPDDPFVLYNLGAVALTNGETSAALNYLGRSLTRCRPGDPIARKLHVLTSRAHHEAQRPDEALTACRTGRAAFPDDAELLHWEAVLLNERGDLAGAEACLRQVLRSPLGRQFMSCDAGLRGYRTRHFLADLCRRQGRLTEAESHWRAAVKERPDFTPGWQALARLLLEQERWQDLEVLLPRLAADRRALPEAALLWTRALLAQSNFTEARRLLTGLIAHEPSALAPRILLSHALLQEGTDLEAAEKALDDVLALAPENAEARHNLAVLHQRRSRGARPRVSLCMIVRDEEANLPDCLASAADLVDEVIVVDTGSTDGTKEIAARFGAKVFEFPWVDDFAAARNESLRHAAGEWIFWMDADDRLDEENRGRLRRLFVGLNGEGAAYVMNCLCLPDPVTQTATAVHHLRLFRNHPSLRWTYRVHEQILPAIRRQGHAVRFSDVVIQHTGYQDPALRGRKLQRDLRLLRLDHDQRPDDPFTLFNLGQVYQELGQLAEAEGMFQRSLERSQPADSITRKLYALLAQCRNRLGRREEALAVCRAGRALFPDDIELLFQEGVIRRGLGDRTGAEVSWRQLLETPPGEYFASMATGLRGHLTRHNLATLYRETGCDTAAESEWRAALTERPDYEPAWRGLAELLCGQERWEEAEHLAVSLANVTGGELKAAAVRGRALLARRDFDAARRFLADVRKRFPQAVEPQLLLSYALLQEGRDWSAAERALRDVLTLAPAHAEARHNLEVLLRERACAG